MKQTPIERLLEAQISVSYAGTQSVSECLSDTFEQEIKAYEKEVIMQAYLQGQINVLSKIIVSQEDYYENVFGKTDAAKSEFDGSGVNRQKIDEVGQLEAKETTEYPTKERVEQLINEMHNQPMQFVPSQTTFTAQEILSGMWHILRRDNREVSDAEMLVFGKLSAMLHDKINNG